MKKVLLISNRVMHYRVSLYNYFHERFHEQGIEFIVRTNRLQQQNLNSINFDFKTIDFRFNLYKEEIKKLRPDVVILFLHLKEKLYWWLSHWLLINKIPFIYWNKAKNYDDPDNKIKNFLFRYLQNRSSAILLYSPMEAEHIEPRNRKKVFFANNTLNFYDFPNVVDSKEEIKKEFSIPFRKFVLAVGRMGVGGGRKKISHLIEIFKDINYEGIGLVLVGSGMSPELQETINSNNTIYLGELHDPENILISKVFKAADLFSLPGHIGLGINQAFFWGLPVVTEEGHHPPEINYLINGRNGFIVPENDLKSLKEKIILLLENHKMIEGFSNNARHDIFNNASPEKMFQAFENAVHYSTNR